VKELILILSQEEIKSISWMDLIGSNLKGHGSCDVGTKICREIVQTLFQLIWYKKTHFERTLRLSGNWVQSVKWSKLTLINKLARSWSGKP